MIHAVKKLPDITLKHETWFCSVCADSMHYFLQSCNAFVRTVSDPARKRRRYKSFLKNRVANRKNGVMQNAVAHARLMNMPLLWIGDIETGIGAVLVSLGFQFAVKLEDIFFKPPFEPDYVQLVPLVTFEGISCPKEVLR